VSLLLLVIPVNGSAQRILNSSGVSCSCGSEITATENRILYLAKFLDELLVTINYKADYTVNVRRRIFILLRILIKRPVLLVHACFKSKAFIHSKRPDRSTHQIKIDGSEQLWYTTSGGRFGFPWNYNAQSNSLNAIRSLDLNFLIGVYPESNGNDNKRLTSFGIDVETLAQHQNRKQFLSKTKSTWGKTELRQVSNSKVLHGTVITKNGVVHLQHHESLQVPNNSDKLPNSLWYSESESCGFQFMSPKPNLDIGYLSDAILISSEGDNFYHFVSESLRALVFSRISGNDCSNVIIRSGLPEQFYELIRMISPGARIVKVSRNESINVGLLHYAQFESPLSQNPRFFFNINPLEILHSDEYLVWRWIRNMFSAKPEGFQKVYLPRQKHESRGILNSKSLELKLTNLSFYVVMAGKMDAASQIQLFGNTKLFFSATGAGLLNTIFMPANSTVIELKYPTGASWEFLPRLFDINYDCVEINKLFSGKIWESLDVYLAPKRDVLAKLSRFSE